MDAPVSQFLVAAGRRLEYRWLDPSKPERPTLVFLHEGLGCLALWRDFPDRLAAATGCGVLVYSRYGHGRSDVLGEARTVDYMHTEALETLPQVLAALEIERPVLIGHSDGASIALIHAGAGYPVTALVLEASHVFVEDVTVESIAKIKVHHEQSNMVEKMARYHDNPARTFYGWNDIWLDPAFRNWNIEGYLLNVACPILLIQGADDEYGTTAQLEAIERQVAGPVQRLLLSECRHAPHHDQPEATLTAMTAFIDRL